MCPQVDVRFLLHFREWAGTPEARIEADTVRDLVARVQRDFHLEGRILEGSRPRPWTRILLNGRDVMLLGGLDRKLSPGDRVAFVYPFMESG